MSKRTRGVVALYCWLSVVFALSTGAVSAPADGEKCATYLREITSAINPVSDGYVNRVILHGDRLVYHRHGSGMSVECGSLFCSKLSRPQRSKLSRPQKRDFLCGLGLGQITLQSRKSPERKVVHSCYPRLVAAVGTGWYILNLMCCCDFPTETQKDSGELAGNIVLFSGRTKTFRNLTQLDGRSGNYVEALRWFPKQRVLLLEESKQWPEANLPMPVAGTGKPQCRTLSGWKEHAISDFPEIQTWYRRHKQIRVKRTFLRHKTDTRVRWTVTGSKNAVPIVFETGFTEWGLRAYPISDGVVCVSNEALGTFLVDFDQTFELRVSRDVAIDYDYDSKKLVLKSRTSDENGQHRYWTFKLDDYMAHLIESIQSPRP